MEIRKLSSPPEPEEIRSMVRYSKNVIEEFRRAKHYKNILFLWKKLFFSRFHFLWSKVCPLSLCQFVFFLKVQPFISQTTSLSLLFVLLFLDSLAPPSELLEMCELSLEKMGAVFADTNVYMLHMMYQAMGVCLYMQDWDGAMSYGEKIIQPYR